MTEENLFPEPKASVSIPKMNENAAAEHQNSAGGEVVHSGVSRIVEDSIQRHAEALERHVEAIVKGQSGVVRACFIALLVQGHVLLEGPPGTAKTLLVRTLSQLSSLRFRRIQFTPDLMPSDITGTSLFRPDRSDFEFRPGPIFSQLLLADEINRAPSRTQAALLQAMQENTVSADGKDHFLGDIFCVIATQNPLESEGTYPLPEAELDRFLFKLKLNFPAEDIELAILQQHGVPQSAEAAQSGFSRSGGESQMKPLFDQKKLKALRECVCRVKVHPDVSHYALKLLRATREHAFLRSGASTRAGVMLLRAARALAAIQGRDYLVPDDVRDMLIPTFRHRLFLTAAAELDGLSTDTLLLDLLEKVAVPR